MMITDVRRQLRRWRARNPLVSALLTPVSAASRAVTERGDARARDVATRFAERLVEDPVISVPDFQGVFSVSARSDLLRRIVTIGDYEPELSRLCTRLAPPERDVIDVGANVGFFSVLFARTRQGTARVLACEPTPAALARLHANLARNGVQQRVIVFPGVVGAQVGSYVIHAVTDREEYSSVGTVVHPSAAAMQSCDVDVEGLTLDELVQRHGLSPGFVKIDVEGYECQVLRGAGEVLRRHRPVVVCELYDPMLRSVGDSAQAVLDAFRRAHYVVKNADDPRAPIDLVGHCDLVAVPAECAAILDTLETST